MGKPYSIKEDHIIRNAKEWYRSPAAILGDASLTAYSELQRILSRSLDFLYSGTRTPSGLQVDCDYMLVIKTIETQVVAWSHEWQKIIEANPVGPYPKLMAEFYFNYSMLVLNSFGLQNAIENSAVDIGHFFIRCHSCATACATITRDELAPKGFLKYSPDSHFVMVSYAVLSLLKLIRSEFQKFLADEQKTLSLVKDVADTLENIAANSHHTPALYSSFVRALITARVEPPAVNGESAPPTDGKEGDPGGDEEQSVRGGFNSSLASGHILVDDPLNEFQFDSEMGPVADMSTFPPTMAAYTTAEDSMNGMMSMDSIFSNNFWDSVLVPGYSNTLEGLSGGFVFGAGGSGLITPRWSQTPIVSETNTPPSGGQSSNALTQLEINAAFHEQAVPSKIIT
jgi:hypothetical protein